MFKTRLISGIVLVIILIVTVGTGGPLLFGVLLAASLIGLFELYRVVGVQNKLLGFAGYLAAIGYYCAVYRNRMDCVMPLLVLLILLLMAIYVLRWPEFASEQVTMAFFGVVYVAVMLSCVYLTRELPEGDVMVWLIFLSSWGCDTCAYCVGRLIGKHKLAPVLSPKKSIEGGVGGVVGAALLGAIFAGCMNQFAGEDVAIGSCALICGAGAVISQIGDLSASAIKRNHQIKDYGKLIPGHGGILDRFDSVIFTAPIIYILALFAL